MTKYRVTGARWAVGIDPSLTGFALGFWHPDRAFVTARFTSKHKGVDRLIDIQLWMLDLIMDVTHQKVGEICMEGYAQHAKWQREAMGELGAAVKLALKETLPEPVCYPTVVPPLKLKKFITGKGNGSKDLMMMGVFKKWGYESPNNDEADAYALARLAACTLGTDQPQFAYEREVIEGLTRWTENPVQAHN